MGGVAGWQGGKSPSFPARGPKREGPGHQQIPGDTMESEVLRKAARGVVSELPACL